MYLIAGLGNIGNQYDLTRHNIGFEVIDRIAERYGIDMNKEKFNATIGQGRIEGEKVLLLKPSTYMNLSGRAILPAMDYFDIETDHLLVIHDDIDFETGCVKVREQGSGGTHNGVNNIIYTIQSDRFPRIRIGIGVDRRMDLASYVLGKFKPDEIPIMQKAVDTASDAVRDFIMLGIDVAMNRYNCKTTLQETEDEKE